MNEIKAYKKNITSKFNSTNEMNTIGTVLFFEMSVKCDIFDRYVVVSFRAVTSSKYIGMPDANFQ